MFHVKPLPHCVPTKPTFHVKHQPSSNITRPLIQPLRQRDPNPQNHNNHPKQTTMFHVKHPQRHNQPQHKNLTVKPTQKDPQQANHQKAVTHRSLFSRWKNPFMPTDDKPEKIRHLSYFSLLLKSSHACQCLETLNRISQQLNKIQNQCFTWNTLTSLGRRKAKQCFTWNKWVVVKTSCFTWNIEKHWNTRKHKT